MSVQMLDRVYDHHHLDYLRSAARAIGYRPRQSLPITLPVARPAPKDIQQAIENIGGPGRTRTSNQTVMSGRTKVAGVDFPGDSTRSALFVASRCDRFWCETGAVIPFACACGKRPQIRLRAARRQPGARTGGVLRSGGSFQPFKRRHAGARKYGRFMTARLCLAAVCAWAPLSFRASNAKQASSPENRRELRSASVEVPRAALPNRHRQMGATNPAVISPIGQRRERRAK